MTNRAFLSTLSNQWAPPTLLGFSVFGSGLLLASTNYVEEVEDEEEFDIDAEEVDDAEEDEESTEEDVDETDNEAEEDDDEAEDSDENPSPVEVERRRLRGL